jgi:hypothetical protein
MKSSGAGLSRVMVRNPVWVSRRFATNTHVDHPQPSKLAIKLFDAYGSCSDSSIHEYAHLGNYWFNYSMPQLAQLRPLKSLAAIAHILATKSIKSLTESFADLTESYRSSMPDNRGGSGGGSDFRGAGGSSRNRKGSDDDDEEEDGLAYRRHSYVTPADVCGHDVLR